MRRSGVGTQVPLCSSDPCLGTAGVWSLEAQLPLPQPKGGEGEGNRTSQKEQLFTGDFF